MGVDPQTLANNLAIIIGGVTLLLLGSVAIYSLWTGASIAIWLVQRRRAEKAFKTVSLRPDGKPYPPSMDGVCSRCKRGNRRIYFAGSGHELCPACYDSFWRDEERSDEIAKGEAKAASE